MGNGGRRAALLFLLIVFSILSIAFGIFLGAERLDPGTVWGAIVGSQTDSSIATIVCDVRMPRVLLAFLVGAILSCSGGVFQGLLRNPLADPFVIGVSSGSALGAAIAIILKIPLPEAVALIFGLATVILVFRIAEVRGRLPVMNVLLAGFAVGSMASALLSLFLYVHSRDVAQVIFWLMGSFAGARWNLVLFLLPVFVVACGIMIFHSRGLNILSLGEEAARTLGVPAEGVKKTLVVVSSIATAATVCCCGVVGFVGLIVPHALRLIVGPDHRLLLPASLLAGGALLTVADTVSRTIVSPTEIPVGVITSLIGIPFFIVILRSTGGGRATHL